MKTISTNDCLKPSGHYAQAIEHNGFIFVSGQLSIDPTTGKKKFGTIEEETQQVLENLERILLAAGSDKNHVVKTTLYIADIALWDQVNRVYSAFFANHKPARAVVPTRELHFGFKIEIEAIAIVKEEE